MTNANKEPAFPHIDTDEIGQRNGLTKRELFAAMAMQGMLANAGGPIQANPTNGWSLTNCDSDDVAHVACLLADSLLAKLAS